MKKHTLNSIGHLKSVTILGVQQNGIVGGQQGEGFIPPPSSTTYQDEKVKGNGKGKGGSKN